MRAPTLFLALGLTGCALGSADGQIGDDHQNLEFHDTAADAILHTKPSPSGFTAQLQASISADSNVVENMVQNVDEILPKVGASVENLLHDDHRKRDANLLVSFPPKFLCPGPCTDCAPFEKFVGNGAIPTPSAELKRNAEPQVASLANGGGLGNMIPTVDADGNAIFVTRTGNYASTTTTVSNDGLTLTVYPTTSAPAASTVTQTVSAGQATVTKVFTSVITETMFDPVQRCVKQSNPSVSSATVANIFGDELLITAATQTHDNTVIVVPPSPQATLFPLSGYQNFVLALLDLAGNQDALDNNARDILDADLGDLRTRHTSVDWVMVAELGYVLQKAHGSIDRDLAMKFATIWALAHPEISTRAEGSSCHGSMGLTKRDGAMSMTEANLNGNVVPITAPTQTYDESTVVVVATTTPFDYPSAARHNFEDKKNKILPPPCLKGPGHNKTECKRAKCMMKHYKPINITTVFPAAMLGDNGETAYGYFTHSTELTSAHFGKTKASATYYPTKATVTMDKSLRLVPTATVEVPGEVCWRRVRSIQDDTKVWDHKSACARCDHEATHLDSHFWWMMLGLGLGVLGILWLLSLLCCFKLFRKHRAHTAADPNRSYRLRLEQFFRRANPTAVVVDPSTGQPMAQIVQTSGGHSIDPALAAAGGAVVGSSLASQPAGTTQTVVTDGKGTLGRKAEEGRGQVQFAEGTTPAAAPSGVTKVVTTPAGEQVVTTAPTGASTTEHAVTAPATTTVQHVEPIAVHDGANDGAPTGRQMADMGSMRGRKKNRHESAYPDMLNLRF